MKGEAGCRKSKRSCHRSRCLRVDKKRARREGKTEALMEAVLNAPVQFGLVQQGHVPTIKAALAQGKTWEEIGAIIGWEPDTARRHYEALHLPKENE